MFHIESRNGARVVDDAGQVRTFTTRTEALAAARELEPQMPSKELPLRVRLAGTPRARARALGLPR